MNHSKRYTCELCNIKQYCEFQLEGCLKELYPYWDNKDKLFAEYDGKPHEEPHEIPVEEMRPKYVGAGYMYLFENFHKRIPIFVVIGIIINIICQDGWFIWIPIAILIILGIRKEIQIGVYYETKRQNLLDE